MIRSRLTSRVSVARVVLVVCHVNKSSEEQTTTVGEGDGRWGQEHLDETIRPRQTVNRALLRGNHSYHYANKMEIHRRNRDGLDPQG